MHNDLSAESRWNRSRSQHLTNSSRQAVPIAHWLAANSFTQLYCENCPSPQGGHALLGPAFQEALILATARVITALSLTITLGVMCSVAKQLSAADSRASHEAILSQRGLTLQQKKWLSPLEIDMQRRVRRLPRLEASLLDSRESARRLAERLITTNMRVEVRLQTAKQNVQTLLAGRAELRSPGQRRVVDARIKTEQETIKRLSAAHIDPEMIVGLPAMRQAMITLTNSRNDLAATILWIHDTRPLLREQYEELASQRQVSLAMKALGSDYRLGSGEDYDSPAFLRKLAGYEELVFTDELPLYRDNGELRVAAFIERTPVTFTWHSSGEPTMLTASVIEATGLSVPDDAPRMTRRFPDGQELVVRQLEIPYLRFGRHLLTNVSAFALPPEGEQYGAQIGPAAFADHSPRAEPKEMRLVIR